MIEPGRYDLKKKPKDITGFEEKIWYAWKHMGFIGILVYGVQGAGKTSFALKLGYNIYRDWDKVLELCIFDIREFIDLIENYKGRIPYVIIDDAGVWFSKYWFWRDVHYVDYVSALLQLIRVKVSCLVLTTTSPSALMKSIRNMDMYVVKIVPAGSKTFVRDALVYRQSILPSGSKRVRLLRKIVFNCKLPDDVYRAYMEKRAYYMNHILPFLKERLKLKDLKIKVNTIQIGRKHD